MMKPVGAATPDTSVPKPTILVQNCSMNSSASSGDALVAVRPADVDRAKFPSPVTGCAGLDLIDLLHHVQLAAAFRGCDEDWHRRVAAGIQGERTCRVDDRRY